LREVVWLEGRPRALRRLQFSCGWHDLRGQHRVPALSLATSNQVASYLHNLGPIIAPSPLGHNPEMAGKQRRHRHQHSYILLHQLPLKNPLRCPKKWWLNSACLGAIAVSLSDDTGELTALSCTLASD